MERKYFRKYDLFIYLLIIGICSILFYEINQMSGGKGSKVEVYVDGKLQEIYNLKTETEIVLIDTNLGGVKLKFEENKVRAISSNSPLKLIVKQGWISGPGEMLIGIPDKMIVKVKGDSKEEELDYILK